MSGETGSVEQISAFKKSVTGRVIPKSERERLEVFEHMLSGMQAQEAPQIGRVETDFYRNSVRMGNTDYVAIARSFHLTPQQLAEFLKSQQSAPSGDGPLQKQEDKNED